MKNTLILQRVVIAALCLFQGGTWAQYGRDNDNGRDNGRDNGHVDRKQGDRGQSKQRDRQDDRQDDRRDDMRGRRQGGQRGAGPDHAYYRGERLPDYYRGRQYVVDDWRGHGLHEPPRGYHWVQTGGDYVLVAIATGIIFELLLNQ